MNPKKPFRRTFRPIFKNGIETSYMFDPDYAVNSGQYIRSYLIIQNDFEKILEYIEPCDKNLLCYSMRIQELLFRICVEVEANLTAILSENKYKWKKDNLTIKNYHSIEKTHYLSHYQVKLPYWSEKDKIFTPFDGFKEGHTLPWYQAYNKTKHSKYIKLEDANLKNLTDAITGLLALISSQFYLFNFNKNIQMYCTNDLLIDFQSTIGDLFSLKYPVWRDDDLYDFNWQDLKGENQKFDILTFQEPPK